MRQLCDVRRVLGDVPGAAAAGQDLLKACEQRHGPASLPVASALRALASVYRTSSDMRPLAKPLLLRAMGILTRHLGGDHEKVAAALTSLAVLSMRCVAKVCVCVWAWVCASHTNSAVAHSRMYTHREGQSEEAARYHKKALEMRSRLQSEGKGPASDGAEDGDGGSDIGGGGGKEGATKGSNSGGKGDAGAADSEEEEGQVLDFKTFEWKASDGAA